MAEQLKHAGAGDIGLDSVHNTGLGTHEQISCVCSCFIQFFNV